MSIRGIFASHSGMVGERQTDLAGRVLQLGYTGTAPLLALSAGMPKEKVTDTAFAWTEDSHISGNTAATNTVNSASQTFTVADANIWVPNSILVNQTTGEHMLVTGINGLTITVVRGISGTTPAAITATDRIQSIGTAYAEGSGRPQPVTQKGESRTNYVQIFKNGWAITGTATAIGWTTGSQLAYNRQQAFAYHAEDIERAFMFGKPGVMVHDNKQLRLSAGIVHQIETYGGLVESAATGSSSGDLSMDDLLDFLRRIFDKNVKGMPNERISFCGSGVVAKIQQMVRMDSRYNIGVGESSYGIKVMKLLGFNGDLTLATHPMMTENTAWGDDLYVFHPGLIKKRELRPSWQWENNWNGTNNYDGNDSTEGFIAIELGFQAEAVETMGILKNIQEAVPSDTSA